MQFSSVFSFSAVCWWARSSMAGIFWDSCSSILLFSLLFREWSCSHWGHVYGVLVCRQCTWHPTIIRSHGAIILIKPHGWSNPLWNRVSSCVLWSELRSFSQVVGLWLRHLCGQHHYLAWSRRSLVEVYWLVVGIIRITCRSQIFGKFQSVLIL